MRSFQSVPTLSVSTFVVLLLLAHDVHAGRSVALLPLTPGPNVSLTTSVDDALRAEIANVEHAQLQAKTRTARAAADCALDDTGCFVDIGERLGVQQLVHAHLDGTHLSLVSYDIPARVVEGRVSGDVSPNVLDAKEDARKLLVQLLDPGAAVGSLTVHTAQPGVEVFIDGVFHGKTPLAGPIHQLSDGRHLVKLRKDGHRERQGFVQVDHGKDVALNVHLDKGEGTAPLVDDVDASQPSTVSNTGVSPLLIGGSGVLAVGGVCLMAAVGSGAFAALLGGPAEGDSVAQRLQRAQNVNTAWAATAALASVGVLAGGAGAVMVALPLLE